MYTKKAIIHSVGEVKLHDDKVFLFGSQSLRVINDDLKISDFICVKENVIACNLYKKVIQFMDAYSNSFFYNYEKEYLGKTELINYYEINEVDDFIAFIRSEKKTVYTKGKFEFEGKILNIYFNKNRIVFSNVINKTLFDFDILSGEKIWELSINEIGNIVTEDKNLKVQL